MNNDLFYGMNSCCKTINGIFNTLLSIPIKMPGNRANPRLKFTKTTQYKDRYVIICLKITKFSVTVNMVIFIQ